MAQTLGSEIALGEFPNRKSSLYLSLNNKVPGALRRGDSARIEVVSRFFTQGGPSKLPAVT
jgi:hypothetical protein